MITVSTMNKKQKLNALAKLLEKHGFYFQADLVLTEEGLDEIGELDGQLARIEDIYCFIIRAEPRHKGICVALFDNNNALVALCIGRYLDNAVVAADKG